MRQIRAHERTLAHSRFAMTQRSESFMHSGLLLM